MKKKNFDSMNKEVNTEPDSKSQRNLRSSKQLSENKAYFPKVGLAIELSCFL